MSRKENKKKRIQILSILTKQETLYMGKLPQKIDVSLEEASRLVKILEKKGYVQTEIAISFQGVGLHIEISDIGREYYQSLLKSRKLKDLAPNRFLQIVGIFLAIVAIVLGFLYYKNIL